MHTIYINIRCSRLFVFFGINKLHQLCFAFIEKKLYVEHHGLSKCLESSLVLLWLINPISPANSMQFTNMYSMVP